MSEQQFSRKSFRREVLAYHFLPGAGVLALVGIYLAVFLLGGNLLLATLVAVIPCVFIIWRWGLAGRRIDKWGCPNCKQPFPKKMSWTYPPTMCPSCGKSIND
jgi:hypothetical protein